MIHAEFRVGEVLGRGFGVYFKNFVSFTIIMAVAYSPLLIYMGTLSLESMTSDEQTTLQLLQNLAQFVLSTLASAMLINGTFQQLRGSHASLASTVAVGFRRFLPALGTLILAFLVLLAPIVIASVLIKVLGDDNPIAIVAAVICAVSAVYLYCALWVSVPAAVVERPGVVGALKRSWQLTKGHRGGIFGLLLLLVLILIGFGMIIGIALTAVEDVTINLWIMIGFSIVFAAVQATITAVGYHDLRLVKDGISVEDLEAVFD